MASAGEAPVLECTISLSLLSGPVWPWVAVFVIVPFVDQISTTSLGHNFKTKIVQLAQLCDVHLVFLFHLAVNKLITDKMQNILFIE